MGAVVSSVWLVRYRNAVGVAGQKGEHRLGTSERRLGINNPAFFAYRREVPQESASFGTMREADKESELIHIMEGTQASEASDVAHAVIYLDPLVSSSWDQSPAFCTATQPWTSRVMRSGSGMPYRSSIQK